MTLVKIIRPGFPVYLAICFMLAFASIIGCSNSDEKNDEAPSFLYEIDDEYPPTTAAGNLPDPFDDDDDDDSTVDDGLEKEPNNEFATATDLGLLEESLVTGGIIEELTDNDIFKFFVGSETRVKLTLRWPDANANLRMRIYNENTTLIATTIDQDDGTNVSDLSMIEGNFYYVWVDMLNNSSSTYSLSIKGREDTRPHTVIEDELSLDAVTDAIVAFDPDEDFDQQLVDWVTERVMVGDLIVFDKQSLNVTGVVINTLGFPPAIIYNEGFPRGQSYFVQFGPGDMPEGFEAPFERNYLVTITFDG